MPKLRVYEYKNCSTCKKALKYLADRDIPFEAVPIVDEPPSVAELKKMLAHYDGKLGRLFNTSGELYREMKLSAKLPGMTEAQALALLAKHGKLVKRPFVLTPRGGVVGFKEDEWKKTVG